MARCHSLSWSTQAGDGSALFSLRPENVRFVTPGTPPAGDGVRFQGRVRDQAFHGATELLLVEGADGLVFTVRTASRPDLQGELELEFRAADAVPVRASAERS